MLELYQHDVSDVWKQDLDAHGEYGYPLDAYFRSDTHRAFVFSIDGHHAGFALVNDDVCLPENELWMAQFFVVRKYRRGGVGTRAAEIVFDAMPGRWEVGQMAGNAAATAFWRATIARYTKGAFRELELHDATWDGHLQCFDASSSRR